MSSSYRLIAAVVLIAASPLFAGEADLFEAPKLKDIAIDGKADDWGDKGLKVAGMTDGSGKKLPAENFEVSFRLGWDEKGLLIIVTVTDDVALESAEKPQDLWKSDSIEIFAADKKGGEICYQAVISPGRDKNKPELRSNLSDYRKEKKNKLAIETQSTVTDKGYVIEARLPWTNLNIEAAENTEIGFQFFANDVDKEGDRYQALWFPKSDIHADKNNMQRIKLGGEK